MIEFTGERVVPGEVEQDLWNEHIARYAFAARFATGRRVLDVGCGTGYGSAELSRTAASVLAIDVSTEAAGYAHAKYPFDGVTFLAASATAIPFKAGTFDLVTAFEVIEHIEDWRALLGEASRVLATDGVFLVSTPNKAYYTESRGAGGANPYHVHEFEYEEFREELSRVYPSVQVLLQDRSEAFAFRPPKTYAPVEARIESGGGLATDAHFFVAVCSARPIPHQSFIYMPRAANVLAERERHIALLENDLGTTKTALSDLYRAHQEQGEHLENQNRWGIGLENDLHAAQKRIVDLQDAFAAEQKAALETARAYEELAQRLEGEIAANARWARDTEQRLTAELDHLKAQAAEIVQLKETAERELTERTQWALDLQSHLERTEAKLRGVRLSRWVRLGRLFGIGPEL